MFTTAKPPSQTTDVAISDASGSEEEDSAVLMRMDSDISLPRGKLKSAEIRTNLLLVCFSL